MKYFQLTKNEQYGILGFLIILGCLLGVKYYSLQLRYSVQKASIVADVKEDLKKFQKEDIKYFSPKVKKKKSSFFTVIHINLHSSYK